MVDLSADGQRQSAHFPRRPARSPRSPHDDSGRTSVDGVGALGGVLVALGFGFFGLSFFEDTFLNRRFFDDFLHRNHVFC